VLRSYNDAMNTKEPLRSMPVYLTDAVRKRLRLAAAQHDTTMTAIASKAIEEALDRLDQRAEGSK
jgi:predicted transcriptional regulator